MKNNKTILVDCNYVGHAARFAVDKNLRTTSGKSTYVIYGFLQTVLNLCQVFETNQLVFVWDSRKSLRKTLFPQYKASRHKKQTEQEKKELESAYAQFQILRKRVLPTMGFRNNFLHTGFEGDDLIAKIIREDRFGRHFLIYASDHDLYQLLAPNVVLIKRKQLYSIDDFVQEFGINPSQWWQVKALAGCTSDEVTGIEGVGEKTACKYLRKELKENSSVLQRIKDQEEEVCNRNRALVRLPFDGTPDCCLVKNEFDIKATRKLFQEYEFNSFLEDFDEWRQVLK